MNRAELRQRETAIWDRMLDSVLANHWTQVGIKIVAVIGGSLIAGIGGGMEGPLFLATSAMTQKGVMIILGAGASGLGGILLIAADRERPSLVSDVRRDLANFREYLDRYDELEAREDWRVDCDTARTVMLGAVEEVLLNPGTSTSDNVGAVLEVSCMALLDAFGVCEGEDYTLSVFCRDDAGGEMTRIAHQWYDDYSAELDQRCWCKTEGFTGQAWANRRTIGVPDALHQESRQIYVTPPRKTYRPGNTDGVRADDERYRSFACAPIVVGEDPEPWGIITVTSDVVGRFDAVDAKTRGGDNIPTLKIAAALFALVAAAGPKSNGL